jgi:hypothetical protein
MKKLFASVVIALAMMAMPSLQVKAQSEPSTFTNTGQAGFCGLGAVNCTVPLDGGGTLYFYTTNQTLLDGTKYQTETIHISGTPPGEYQGNIQLLPVTMQHTIVGAPNCYKNNGNEWVLTVPQTTVEDGFGNTLTVSMTQTLTWEFRGYGRNSGCHYVPLGGTTQITIQ